MARRNPKTNPRPGDVLALGRSDARCKRIEVVRVVARGAHGALGEVHWRGLLGGEDGGCDFTWWTAMTRYWSVEGVAGESVPEQMQMPTPMPMPSPRSR